MPRRTGFRAIVITGASSGLGATLARLYAAPGVTLGLVGRNVDRLELVAAACRAAGATVRSAALDIREAAPLTRWLEAFDRDAPIELLIANAGISAGPAPGRIVEGLALASDQVRVNLLGAMNTIEPLLPALISRGTAHIGIVSSVASYRGLPYSPAYSASKAGVRLYGEALRAALAPRGLKVSVVCPGFFASPMTDRFIGGHPFEYRLDQAAAIVKRGLDRGQRRIVFPWLLMLGLVCADLMPAFLGDAIVRRFHFHIVPG
jgi:short-subunit dehydrogenase